MGLDKAELGMEAYPGVRHRDPRRSNEFSSRLTLHVAWAATWAYHRPSFCARPGTSLRAAFFGESSATSRLVYGL